MTTLGDVCDDLFGGATTSMPRARLASSSHGAFVSFAFVVVVSMLASANAAAHTTSRGALFVEIDDDTNIKARLEMEEKDTFDLFDVDMQSAAEETRFSAVLVDSIPRFLRFSDGQRRCETKFSSWQRRGVRTLVIHVEAMCPPDVENLTIEWGFSALSTLDLVTIATIVAPDDIRHATVFSRRTPKESFAIRKESPGKTLATFSKEGVHHILIGFDHIAFLLALLLGCATLGRLLVVVTSFTLAHSVTLGLGAFSVVTVVPSVVEPIIAVSIVVAAGIQWHRLRNNDASWPGHVGAHARSVVVEGLLAFGFGLIHGLGFASMLMDMMGVEVGVTSALVGFNVGVEAGQLAILAVVFPVARRVGRHPKARVVMRTAAAALMITGTMWVIERVVG